MTLSLQRSPEHEHDCGVCMFLGNFDGYDLYYCTQDTKFPTIIARWGRGADYLSGATIAEYVNINDSAFKEQYVALRVAYLIAKDLDLEI